MLLFRGKPVRAWVLADFCLADGYRSLGPALLLQRQCLDAILRDCDVCYDFPSKAMMAIYARLGLRNTVSLVRWARPVRVDERLGILARTQSVKKAASKLGAFVLAARGWKGSTKTCETAYHIGLCGEEFSELDRRLKPPRSLRTSRMATYLNWRFRDDESRVHCILTARRRGRLIGYVVTRHEPAESRIVDLAAVEEAPVVARLIHSAVKQLSSLGAKTVNLAAGSGHPWAELFQRCGFRRREQAPVVALLAEGTTISQKDLLGGWHLMDADRDY